MAKVIITIIISGIIWSVSLISIAKYTYTMDKKEEEKMITNRERLFQMSDEELGKFLADRTDCDYCELDYPCGGDCEKCIDAHIEWLQKEG